MADHVLLSENTTPNHAQCRPDVQLRHPMITAVVLVLAKTVRCHLRPYLMWNCWVNREKLEQTQRPVHKSTTLLGLPLSWCCWHLRRKEFALFS